MIYDDRANKCLITWIVEASQLFSTSLIAFSISAYVMILGLDTLLILISSSSVVLVDTFSILVSQKAAWSDVLLINLVNAGL